MTEFVYGLAVVVALGVALLAGCLWFAREQEGEAEAAPIVPRPAVLHAVEPVAGVEVAPQPLAS